MELSSKKKQEIKQKKTEQYAFRTRKKDIRYKGEESNEEVSNKKVNGIRKIPRDHKIKDSEENLNDKSDTDVVKKRVWKKEKTASDGDDSSYCDLVSKEEEDSDKENDTDFEESSDSGEVRSSNSDWEMPAKKKRKPTEQKKKRKAGKKQKKVKKEEVRKTEPLSSFELARQKNVDDKMAFLQSLRMNELVEDLEETAKADRKKRILIKKEKVVGEASRKSKRTENLNINFSEDAILKKIYEVAANEAKANAEKKKKLREQKKKKKPKEPKTSKEKPVYKEDEMEDSDSTDEESSDKSFAPEESGSEVAEEYDSNASTRSDSDEDYEGSDTPRPKKETKEKKHKEPKKSRSAKTVKEPGLRKRKPKKEKDENKPKRPASAYFLYFADNREKIKKENPGISTTEIAKKAGEMWREVTDKSKWEEAAAEAKKEYEKAMAEYNASNGGKPKKEKDENKPKRPAPAFFLYLADNREKIKKENPGISTTEITKKAGEMWKEVTDKSKWEEAAAEANKEYVKAMAEYNASNAGKAKVEQKIPNKDKEEKVSTAKSPGSFKSKEYVSSSSDSSDNEDKSPKKKSDSDAADDSDEKVEIDDASGNESGSD